MNTARFIEQRLQDLRFAIRQLLRSRGFAGAAIVVPALGIAASVALFGFVDAAMIKPLPYREPARLVTVFSTGPLVAATQTRGQASYLDVKEWRTRARALASIAAYDVRAGFTLTTAAGPEPASGLRVSSTFFRTLGVTPAIGRDFTPEDEAPGAAATALISYGAWQRRFGGRPDILGQSVTLQSSWLGNAERHVVIGVIPRDFHFPLAESAEFWVTIRGTQACWNIRSCRSLEAFGRLAPGVSAETAAAEMTSIVQELRRAHPDAYRNAEVARLVPFRDAMLGNVSRVLIMLLAGALLLLLIACTNVATLVLARTDSRTREIAVRHALGASRRRLMLQFATEALVLAASASVAGVLLASLGMRFLISLLTNDMIRRMPYLQSVGFGMRVAVFAAAVGIVVALVFAATPLARIRVSRSVGLEDGSRGSAGRSWRRVGAHLVVLELAVAVVLLVGAGLLGKSLYRLVHVDAGFNTQQLIGLSVSPGSAAVAAQIAERIGALPGVQSVGYADLLPLSAGLAPASSFWVVGRPESDQVAGGWPVRRVSAGYFRTLQAPLLRGRDFTELEIASARPVIIINDTAARRCFPGQDPIGQWMAFGGPSSPKREIIGIVADIQDGPPDTPPHPSAYVPFDQPAIALAIRFARSDESLFPAITSAIQSVRPDALIGEPTTMTDRVNRLPTTALHRSTAWLIGGFAGLAFLLSVIGLYAVVAYSVGRRTREIGVRMALGARPRSVYRLVLGEAAWLACLGTGLGTIGAVIAATLMRGLFFGVSSWDVPTLVAVGAVLNASALLASYVPARRAASVDPIEVLRAE